MDKSVWNVQNSVVKTIDSRTNNHSDCEENPAVQCLSTRVRLSCHYERMMFPVARQRSENLLAAKRCQLLSWDNVRAVVVVMSEELLPPIAFDAIAELASEAAETASAVPAVDIAS